MHLNNTNLPQTGRQPEKGKKEEEKKKKFKIIVSCQLGYHDE